MTVVSAITLWKLLHFRIPVICAPLIIAFSIALNPFTPNLFLHRNIDEGSIGSTHWRKSEL